MCRKQPSAGRMGTEREEESKNIEVGEEREGRQERREEEKW